MNRRENSQKLAIDSDSTFRFDSKANDKISKDKKSLRHVEQPEIDFSLPTSEVMRHVELRNQNILQLLEDSSEDKKTSKNEKTKRNDLWDFFAKFQKQSNPDITISDIELPAKKNNTAIKQREFYTQRENKKGKKQDKRVSDNQYIPLQKDDRNSEHQERYPKRNRVSTLRYWLGEKCVYRDRKIIDIIRPNKLSGNANLI